MQIGVVGLGKMGVAVAERLARGGHAVTGFDVSAEAVTAATAAGITVVPDLASLTAALDTPRVVWLMLPAGAVTGDAAHALGGLLQPDDVVIDGGNSHYRDTMARAADLADRGIAFVDVGTSGGVRGGDDGFSLMIGGAPEAIAGLEPVLRTLAPAPDRGWAHVGPVGAGHFVKMIHNGIEYGAMQAFAEGFAILDATPEFDLDLAQIAGVWQHGSVVRSWLLDLIAEALAEDPGLADIAPVVADSGEGRWTVQEAMDLDVAAPVITLSLLARLKSRDTSGFSERLLAALRHRFGGHAVERAGGPDG
jgi:6-phosphogluconate dehydrogenase